MDGRVELRGLRCAGAHGAPPPATPIALLVDVSLRLDLSAVSISDAYADTVDLADLAACVRAVDLRLTRAEPPGLDAAAEAVEVRLERGLASS